MRITRQGSSCTSSDLFGMLDEAVALSLLRVARGQCIGCGASNAQVIYWRFRLRMSRNEPQYDTLTVCQPCYDRLQAAGWTVEHEQWYKLQGLHKEVSE